MRVTDRHHLFSLTLIFKENKEKHTAMTMKKTLFLYQI
jgi:hypothetical protein